MYLQYIYILYFIEIMNLWQIFYKMELVQLNKKLHSMYNVWNIYVYVPRCVFHLGIIIIIKKNTRINKNESGCCTKYKIVQKKIYTEYNLYVCTQRADMWDEYEIFIFE